MFKLGPINLLEEMFLCDMLASAVTHEVEVISVRLKFVHSTYLVQGYFEEISMCIAVLIEIVLVLGTLRCVYSEIG